MSYLFFILFFFFFFAGAWGISVHTMILILSVAILNWSASNLKFIKKYAGNEVQPVWCFMTLPILSFFFRASETSNPFSATPTQTGAGAGARKIKRAVRKIRKQ